MYPAHLERGSYEADLIVGPIEIFQSTLGPFKDKWWENLQPYILDEAQTYNIDNYTNPNEKQNKKKRTYTVILEILLFLFIWTYFFLTIFYNNHWTYIINIHNEVKWNSNINYSDPGDDLKFLILYILLNTYTILSNILFGCSLLIPIISIWHVIIENSQFKLSNLILHVFILLMSIFSVLSIVFLHILWITFDFKTWFNRIHRRSSYSSDFFNHSYILPYFIINYVLCAFILILSAIIIALHSTVSRKFKEEMLLDYIYTAQRKKNAYNTYRTNKRRCELNKIEKTEYIKPYVYLKVDERFQQDAVKDDKEESTTI